MTPGQAAAVPSMLPDGRFSGRSEFAALVHQAMVAASVQGWREMIWCDPDFDDWPLHRRCRCGPCPAHRFESASQRAPIRQFGWISCNRSRTVSVVLRLQAGAMPLISSN